MDPTDTASIKQALEALERADAGAEVDLPDGSRARVEESTDGIRGVRINRPDGNNWHLRVFPPLAERPQTFGDQLPFVPFCKASLLETTDGHLLATWEAADVTPVFERIVADCTQAGWLSDPNTPRISLPMHLLQLTRAGKTRVVMQMKVKEIGIVSVFDT
jgi:hypothetical protein